MSTGAPVFQSFTSGSCGNCSFLGLKSPEGEVSGILIDAGASPRTVKGVMVSAGLSLDCIKAIIITHDHYDHIRSLGSFCKKLAVPVFATWQLHAVFSVHPFTREWVARCRRVIIPGEWTEVAPGIEVLCFEVPHDATQTVSYAIRAGEHRMVFMTDLGEFTPECLSFASRAHTVVIESNFDVDMLLGGDYPYELKMRIIKGFGHLSNDACACAVKAFWHEGLRNLFLCHLSGNNNTPAKALECTGAALGECGVAPGTVNLRILPRAVPTPLLYL